MAVTPGISQEMSGAQNPAYRRASHFYFFLPNVLRRVMPLGA